MSKGGSRRECRKAEPSLLESFLACKPLLFHFVGKIVRPEEIEDIVQETFVNSYAASRKQHISSPRAFMLRTARNIALNHLKGARQTRKFELEECIDEQFELFAKSLEEQYESEQRFLLFCRAVSRLPPACRRVFVLCKVYGLSNREVADYLKVHPSTVEKHVARGMVDVTACMKLKGHRARRLKRPSSIHRAATGE